MAVCYKSNAKIGGKCKSKVKGALQTSKLKLKGCLYLQYVILTQRYK